MKGFLICSWGPRSHPVNWFKIPSGHFCYIRIAVNTEAVKGFFLSATSNTSTLKQEGNLSSFSEMTWNLIMSTKQPCACCWWGDNSGGVRAVSSLRLILHEIKKHILSLWILHHNIHSCHLHLDTFLCICSTIWTAVHVNSWLCTFKHLSQTGNPLVMLLFFFVSSLSCFLLQHRAAQDIKTSFKRLCGTLTETLRSCWLNMHRCMHATSYQKAVGCGKYAKLTGNTQHSSFPYWCGLDESLQGDVINIIKNTHWGLWLTTVSCPVTHRSGIPENCQPLIRWLRFNTHYRELFMKWLCHLRGGNKSLGSGLTFALSSCSI